MDTESALLDIIWSSAKAPDADPYFRWHGAIYTPPESWERGVVGAGAPEALNLRGGVTIANLAEHSALAALIVLREGCDVGRDRNAEESVRDMLANLDDVVDALGNVRETLNGALRALRTPRKASAADIAAACRLCGALADATILDKLSELE